MQPQNISVKQIIITKNVLKLLYCMDTVKRIGLLTSGGDAPGMNAAIRAVVRAADRYGIEVLGFENGYEGLLHTQYRHLSRSSVSEIISRGGTILGSSRSKYFREDAGQQMGAHTCEVLDLDALVIIGGDGSFAGAQALSKKGINVICIPATIDLDVSSTDYTIGFDTACNTAIHTISQLRDTSASHQRCSIVEVMGRKTGYIALQCAIACGVDYCVIPENGPYDINHIAKHIQKRRSLGKKHHIIVVAEGSLIDTNGKKKSIDEFVSEVEKATGVESRGQDLGYALRGGSPSVTECVHASEMGVYAIHLLMNNAHNRVIAVKDSKIVDYSVEEALKMKKQLSQNMFELFKILAEID